MKWRLKKSKVSHVLKLKKKLTKFETKFTNFGLDLLLEVTEWNISSN